MSIEPWSPSPKKLSHFIPRENRMLLLPSRLLTGTGQVRMLHYCNRWSPTGIARGTLLHAPVGRHPGQTSAHSSIPAKTGVGFCCRGKLLGCTSLQSVMFKEVFFTIQIVLLTNSTHMIGWTILLFYNKNSATKPNRH